MSDRKKLSKRVRFEVFKRDRFTCQYCGGKAPDVILQVDHVRPLADGGTDDFLNLVAACIDCNGGKGARRLDRSDEVARRRDQAEALQERREQIAMMAQWREELLRLDDVELDSLCKFIGAYGDFSPNEHGRSGLRKWIRKYGFEEVLTAAEIAFSNYYATRSPDEDEAAAREKAFGKIGGVLLVRAKERSIPNYRRLFYVRAILRNNVHAGHDWMPILEEAVEAGVSVEDLEWEAKQARSRSGFRRGVDEWIALARKGRS